MNNKYIAVIDSGVGGLHILEGLIKKFPHENFIYFADEAYFPYGIKPKKDLENRLTKILNKLLTLNIKTLVIACNTASAASFHLNGLTDIPIIEIIKATSYYALKETVNKKIGLWATNGTIKSMCYQNNINKEATCYPVGASDLVEYIEHDQINSKECINAVKGYLKDIDDSDCLILGCTHFPLLKDLITLLNPNLKQISSNFPVETSLHEVLLNNNLQNISNDSQEVIICSSDESLTIKEKVKRFDINHTKFLYLEIK